MKEIALYDAKNTLSALIQEVEETGQDIVITRHGKPAAKLSPIVVPRMQECTAALARLAAIQADAEKAGAKSPNWRTLKRWARDEPDDEGQA
jgi:prevent-host-death family protein